MRIHRLTLRSFRGVANRTVELPETGTTVIVGDNEVGKTSLIEALILLFDLPDDSKSARVRNVQPFGRDLAPEVEVDLSLGGSRIVYGKRWLRNRSTELTLTQADGGRQSFTGREAHNEAARLFEAHVDPVLWRTLMVGQGESLVLPSPADAEPLIAAVTAESGTPTDTASMPLVAAVEQEFLKYWTRGGRPTGDFARAAETVAETETLADEARQAMEAVAADIHRAERLTQDVADLRTRLDEHTVSVNALAEDARHADGLLVRRDEARARAELSRERLDNHTRTRTDRETLLDEVQRRTTDVADLQAARDGAAATSARSAAAAHEARVALETIAELRENSREIVQLAEGRVADLADRTEVEQLTNRRAELAAVRNRIAAASAVSADVRVTDEVLAAIEDAHTAVVTARAALAAGAPEVVVRRLGALPVSLYDDTGRDPSAPPGLAPPVGSADRTDSQDPAGPGSTGQSSSAGPTVAAGQSDPSGQSDPASPADPAGRSCSVTGPAGDGGAQRADCDGALEVAVGETVSRRVSGELLVGVPGELEVIVRAGGEVAALRAEVDRASRAEQDLLSGCGAASPAQARELLRKADAARAELAEARRSERSLTSAGDPSEQIAVLTARMAARSAARDGAVATADTRATTSEYDGGRARPARATSAAAEKRPAVVARTAGTADTGGIADTGGTDATSISGRASGRGTPGDRRRGKGRGKGRVRGSDPDEDQGSLFGDGEAAAAALDEAKAAAAAADVAVADAEFAVAQTRKAADDERAAEQQLATRLELATERADDVNVRLAVARAEHDDDALLAAEDSARAEVEAVLGELTALESQVDAAGADRAPARLADARRVLDQLRGEYDELRDNLRLTEGRLDQSGREGLATRLDNAEAELDRAQAIHQGLRRRADAAHRVHETLARHRVAAQTRYAAPLRDRIEALGRSVYGPTFQVALDEDLTVAERELDGIRLDVDALSTGAREQLAIITRLAISHLVSGDADSVPAIFDDALGWSDKGRLREMGALLGRAGEHGQVIVLTCLPERYEYVPGRKVIRLTVDPVRP